MPYSDLQLKNATQVAYKDFHIPFQQLVEAGEKPPFTIAELCRQWGKKTEDLFPDLDGQDISNWKIVDYYDTNDKTGFYGSVIDVGDGDAIVAFRGSEGMDNMSNLIKDWLKADLGLLNSTLTNQQAEVNKFLKQISESDYIKNYDSLAMTGHSLGGNLAMHAAIVSAMPEIGLADKLERCVSYDGPGFSDEYLAVHGKYIDKVKGKITHYKWSPVGGLLSELPGVSRIPLKYTEKSIFTDFWYNVITRHSTESIEFDGETAKRGEETVWDTLTSKFSQGIDHMPRIVGDTLVLVTAVMLVGGLWMSQEMFKDGEMTLFGVSVLVAAAVCVLAVGPVAVVAMAAHLLFVVVVAFLAVVAYEYTYEFIEHLVNKAVKAVIEFCGWLKDKAAEFREFVSKKLEELKNWFNSNFNRGYQYATSFPQVKVDTFKLRDYASRIDHVNRRISNLDRRMDSLYLRVGLSGLWDLLQADLMTGYSWRLWRAASYLNDTASDFEAVENELASSL